MRGSKLLRRNLESITIPETFWKLCVIHSTSAISHTSDNLRKLLKKMRSEEMMGMSPRMNQTNQMMLRLQISLPQRIFSTRMRMILRLSWLDHEHKVNNWRGPTLLGPRQISWIVCLWQCPMTSYWTLSNTLACRCCTGSSSRTRNMPSLLGWLW